MIEMSKYFVLAITCGAKRGPKDTDLTFSPASLRDFINELAEQPEGEPVGYFARCNDGVWRQFNETEAYAIPLYTSPPKREWQGLTGEERYDILSKSTNKNKAAARVEAKLKEKNT